MPYNTPEKRRDYAREYQRKRRAVDETYRIRQNRRATQWDCSPTQRPHKLMRAAKVRAKKLNCIFTLDREWIDATWDGTCALTGIEFVLSDSPTRSLFSPSIDRIDSSQGYTKDNCRFVLWGINAFKNNGSDADILRIARALIEKE